MDSADSFESSYAKLNAEQRLAVDTIYGPVMVVAGPGTGKTEILALRICKILRKDPHVKPDEILALTFTESGTVAMRERLSGFIGPGAQSINVSTFHSFCNGIIRENPETFFLSDQIDPLTDIEKFRLIRKLIDSLNTFSPLRPIKKPYANLRRIIQRLETLKKEDIPPSKFKEFIEEQRRLFNEIPESEKLNQKGKMLGKYNDMLVQIERWTDLASLYESYQSEIERLGRYDFDDMIMYVLDKLREDEGFRQRYGDRFKFILIDEYQDTNNAQNEIVDILAGEKTEPNIFVVGDDDQSIFRFQGASLENFLYFHTKYPNLKRITLKQNYRNTQTIIDGVTSMIRNNQMRANIDKEFKSNSDREERKIMVARTGSKDVDYFYVVEKIKELKSEGYDFNKIAIMYRNNADADPLMELLKKESIPFNISKAVNVLNSPYVQRLIYLLKVIDDDHNANHNFFKYLFFGPAAIEPADIFEITRRARYGPAIYKLLGDEQTLKGLKIKSRDALMEVRKMIDKLKKNYYELAFPDFLVRALHKSGILTNLFGSEDNLYDLNQMNGMIKWVKIQCDNSDSYSLQEFLSDINFMQENGLSIEVEQIYSRGDGVNLMTAHKSKGLEFPVVFIIECYSKKWEDKRMAESLRLPEGLIIKKESEGLEVNTSIEEERRLFYVGSTRAEERLYLTYPSRREDGRELFPSRFINEIDDSCKENEIMSPYEERMLDMLQLKLKEDDGGWMRDFSAERLQEIVSNVKLSATSLNNYLKCPAKYKYNHICGIPTEATLFNAYGSAVHEVLERIFREAARAGKVPSFGTWKELFERALAAQPMPQKDKKFYLEKGIRDLGGYYEHYRDSFHTDCRTEISFSRKNSVLGGIPLTGKIDKIEILDGNKVRVVDYKTGKAKSRDEILGLNKNGKKDVHNQMVFYKVLAQHSEDFPYEIESTVIDFIEPKMPSGEYIREVFQISEEEVEQLKETIRNVYEKIQNLEFEPTDDESICGSSYSFTCPYLDICRRRGSQA